MKPKKPLMQLVPALGGPADGAKFSCSAETPPQEGQRLWTHMGRHLYRFHTGWRVLGWERQADGSYVRQRRHGSFWLYEGPVFEGKESKAKGRESRE